MNGQVATTSVAYMGITLGIVIALPLGLFFYFWKRKGADVVPFFVGCAVFLVFAMLLESVVHRLVLGLLVGQRIQDNNVFYAVYGGLMAGIFEESGRFLAFSTVLKRYRGKDVNALMYGAGHGCFEALAIVGTAMVNNLIYAMMLNHGTAELLLNGLPDAMRTQMQEVFTALVETPSYEFLLSGVERILAVVIQLSLSVLVWFAVKRGKKRLFLFAIILHTSVDAFTLTLSKSGFPIAATEGMIAVIALYLAFLARKEWRLPDNS